MEWRSGPQSKKIAAEVFRRCGRARSRWCGARSRSTLAVFGAQTGIVVDVGHRFTHVEPVLDLKAVHFAHEFRPWAATT